jgi:hypothetical protein
MNLEDNGVVRSDDDQTAMSFACSIVACGLLTVGLLVYRRNEIARLARGLAYGNIFFSGSGSAAAGSAAAGSAVAGRNVLRSVREYMFIDTYIISFSRCSTQKEGIYYYLQ